MYKLKLTFFVLILFVFGLCFVNLSTVKANELRGTYEFYRELYIDNDSYSLRINRDLDILNELQNQGDFVQTINCNLVYNDITYTQIHISNSDARGTLLVRLKNGIPSEDFTLFEYASYNYDVDFTGRLFLYNDVNYAIILNPTINKLFIFENYILGHYIFNSQLVGVHFGQYDFVEPVQDYKITGSLTYPVDNYYLFNTFTCQINTSYLDIYFYTPRGDEISFEYENLSDEYDYIRYLYFDGQYIDNNLYEFLKVNGSFRFALPKSAYNYTFWDLVNAYVNIPVTIISSFLNVSIFNTGVTLLLVFSTIMIILLAFKVGKMLAWG